MNKSGLPQIAVIALAGLILLPGSGAVGQAKVARKPIPATTISDASSDHLKAAAQQLIAARRKLAIARAELKAAEAEYRFAKVETQAIALRKAANELSATSSGNTQIASVSPAVKSSAPITGGEIKEAPKPAEAVSKPLEVERKAPDDAGKPANLTPRPIDDLDLP